MSKTNLSIVTITLSNGGAERVISLLLKKLVKDFNVTLVLFYDVVDYYIPPEVNKIVLLDRQHQSSSILVKVKDMFSLISRYGRTLKNEDIDISMSFLTLPNIINSIMSMRYKKVKTIISERCYPSLMYKYNKFSMFLVKIAFPLFYNRNDMLFSNSVHINKDLKDNFGVKLPMHVVYNPIEMDDKMKDPTTIETSDHFNIINVGTLYAPKNQKLLLETIAHLNDESFRLTLLGQGPGEKDLKDYATQSGIMKFVDFKGRVTNVKDHLLENDCFVLSSNNEGFPNVLLEAMSAGLPAISTNCMSGPLELLNENEPIDIEAGQFTKAKYGLMINVGDLEGLSQALIYYKNHPEVRSHYSKMSYQRAKHYDLPNIYKQVQELIIS